MVPDFLRSSHGSSGIDMILYVQNLGINIPLFNLVATGIGIFGMLMAIGLITGKCQPRRYSSWDEF